VNQWKDLAAEMDDLGGPPVTVLLDRIDESWDGSDKAVALLMAMMHACVEMVNIASIRPLLFLRENVFERVRVVDREFSRLETFVVSLEWTQELLVELIERRLSVPLISKYPLHGPTWDAFFEKPPTGDSQALVFSYCQYRPRDVLTYCSFAVESAQAKLHSKILIDDLLAARRKFSESRLKDLGDEYADNYPQLQLVLGRFYGLGREFTLSGVDAFIKKLLVDDEIKELCHTWIYKYVQPDLFVQLLYNIGFVGIKNGDVVHYRAVGPQESTPSALTTSTTVVIHPTYGEALNLQNVIVSTISEGVELKRAGLIGELPGAIDIGEYQHELERLRERLQSLPEGRDNASEFETIVGDILRLCFYRSLTNIDAKVRSVDGRVIRDWIAANHAPDGFWELVRVRYSATQIIWECKNYSDLSADDFQQASYYMTEPIGKFIVIAFRGTEIKKSYYEHIKRIAADKKGIILLVGEKDLDIFIRRTINGKLLEGHLQELYDKIVREIS
jgi:hypothetical protein